MRDRGIVKLADWHSRYPWRMAGFVIMISVVLLFFASKLTVSMRMRDLLPAGDPKVDQFNKIIDEFSTSTSLMIVIQGDELLIKEFADRLAPIIPELKFTDNNEEHGKEIDYLKNKLAEPGGAELPDPERDRIESTISKLEIDIDRPFFQRVDYKMEIDFIKSHGLMLIKEEDLENINGVYSDPNLPALINNINNMMEKEYVGQDESMSSREEEDGAVEFLDGIQNFISNLTSASGGEPLSNYKIDAVADKLLYGEPYFLSYDRTTLVMNAIPDFTIMDRDLLMAATKAVQIKVDELLEEYPGVSAGLSGDLAREHDEQVYSQQSIQYTSIIAFIAILILLMLSFRMIVAPVFAAVNLFVCLIWAMGAAYLAVKQLNMMTAMLSVVLLGLGIDFSIHIISGFTEWRGMGDSIHEALEKTFLKSGRGIITGGLTTACAFLALLVSRSKGMKEMGIVTGVGLISVMVGTFLILPPLLVLRERRIDRKLYGSKESKSFIKRDLTFKTLGKSGRWLSKNYYLTISTAALVSGLLIWSALHIEYDKNYLNMEPKGLTSIALMDTVMNKFDLSMEYSLCLADNIEESKRLAEEYRELGTVARTDDISIYLPSIEEQKDRVPHINEIKEKMNRAHSSEVISLNDLEIMRGEIRRLEMNIMEMQDIAYLGGKDKVDSKCKKLVGDPLDDESPNAVRELLDILDRIDTKGVSALNDFQKHFAPYYRNKVLGMCNASILCLEDLPASINDRYSNAGRDKFLITIYPSGRLYTDMDVLGRFVDDMDSVSEKTTGGPIVAVTWMRIAAQDGRKSIILTFMIVFLLLWIDFRKPWYALIAMIPLSLGAFWMVGIMNLSGMMLNFMTMMGLPLIIGIGIDDGVHMMHRWQAEGKGHLYTVFSSTGKAILLTSLTTMLAFGSMVFSTFPAWSWFGSSLFIGVGCCFIATVVVLAGILGSIERYHYLKSRDE